MYKPMKILLAPDKFKDALEAPAVCAAMARGIAGVLPDAEVVHLPLADGGEGTAAVLAHYAGGRLVTCTVQDPLGRPVQAHYALTADGQTAVVELAQASGYQRLRPAERDPRPTTTYGTGQLIADALGRGVSEVVLTLGGSATHDLGTGMAAALGFRFEDATGRTFVPTGATLGAIFRIDESAALIRPGQVRVRVACDVQNPLCGAQGAAHVFAPQKGATPDTVAQLEDGSRHVATLWATLGRGEAADLPGAGAAGGTGAGAYFFLGAKVMPGAEWMLDQAHVDRHLQGADLVLTGEGSLDSQSLGGKLIGALVARAKAAGVPVAAFCGRLALSTGQIGALGLAYAASILRRTGDLPAALADTPDALTVAVGEAVRLFAAGRAARS